MNFFLITKLDAAELWNVPGLFVPAEHIYTLARSYSGQKIFSLEVYSWELGKRGYTAIEIFYDYCVTDIISDIDRLLAPFHQFGVNLGLSRIQTLLTALDSPHQSVPIIHVAGTNGKGSVCAYLSTILTAAGYKVGRYTSPHLT